VTVKRLALLLASLFSIAAPAGVSLASDPGATSGADGDAGLTPPMELVEVYRSWLGHMLEERYEEAAALVLLEDLEQLRETTLRNLRSASPTTREQRFTSLGVGSLEELESLSATELFVEGLRSGGNVLPRLLRASQITILEGEIQGSRGWLRVHMSSSARGGEIVASNDIRQGFERRGERWLVSLRPVPAPAPGDSRTPEKGAP
jgi:hypothetical protein